MVLFVLNGFILPAIFCIIHFFCLPWRKQTRKFRLKVYRIWQYMLASWLHLVVPKIEIYGNPEIDGPGNVLLISNHLSWADIISIYYANHKSWPMVKFMLKSNLVYEIPICVLFCWLSNFPIIKREALRKSKKSKNKNQRKTLKEEITRALDSTFNIPESPNEFSSLVLFPEGTRGTPEKHLALKSQHSYLLPAKTGGVAMSIRSMIKSKKPIHFMNITLIYRGAQPSLLNILLGNITKIEIHLNKIPTPDWMYTDLVSHPPRKTRFKAWINTLWADKDQQITDILSKDS